MSVVPLRMPTPGPAVARPALTLRSLRLRLSQLSVKAGLGADIATLAPALAGLWQEAAASPDRGHELTAEVAVGCCAMARWLDPVRSVQAVPPLCVVVWHVGPLRRPDGPAGLWLDLVLPDDGRRAQAQAWAADIRLLLAHAQIPCQSEWILIPQSGSARSVGPLPAAPRARVWGCQSLFHQYQRSGELQEALAQRVPIAAEAHMNARSQPATVPSVPATTWMQRISQRLRRGEPPPDHWLHRAKRLPEEAYLAQALTLCDLEQRMKRLDRRRAGMFESRCP